MGGREEGREVLLRRDIKWGGSICLAIRGGLGDYNISSGGVGGVVIGAEATKVLGLRVFGGGGGVSIKARGAREASQGWGVIWGTWLL